MSINIHPSSFLFGSIDSPPPLRSTLPKNVARYLILTNSGDYVLIMLVRPQNDVEIRYLKGGNQIGGLAVKDLKGYSILCEVNLVPPT